MKTIPIAIDLGALAADAAITPADPTTGEAVRLAGGARAVLVQRDHVTWRIFPRRGAASVRLSPGEQIAVGARTANFAEALFAAVAQAGDAETNLGTEQAPIWAYDLPASLNTQPIAAALAEVASIKAPADVEISASGAGPASYRFLLTILRDAYPGDPPPPAPGQVWLDLDLADARYAPKAPTAAAIATAQAAADAAGADATAAQAAASAAAAQGAANAAAAAAAQAAAGAAQTAADAAGALAVGIRDGTQAVSLRQAVQVHIGGFHRPQPPYAVIVAMGGAQIIFDPKPGAGIATVVIPEHTTALVSPSRGSHLRGWLDGIVGYMVFSAVMLAAADGRYIYHSDSDPVFKLIYSMPGGRWEVLSSDDVLLAYSTPTQAITPCLTMGLGWHDAASGDPIGPGFWADSSDDPRGDRFIDGPKAVQLVLANERWEWIAP